MEIQNFFFPWVSTIKSDVLNGRMKRTHFLSFKIEVAKSVEEKLQKILSEMLLPVIDVSYHLNSYCHLQVLLIPKL